MHRVDPSQVKVLIRLIAEVNQRLLSGLPLWTMRPVGFAQRNHSSAIPREGVDHRRRYIRMAQEFPHSAYRCPGPPVRKGSPNPWLGMVRCAGVVHAVGWFVCNIK
jgi:hypothetical protein